YRRAERGGWHGVSLLRGPARAPDLGPHGGRCGRGRRAGGGTGRRGKGGARWALLGGGRACQGGGRRVAADQVSGLGSAVGSALPSGPGGSPDATVHTTTHINRPARPDVAAAAAGRRTGGAGLGGPGWLRAGYLQRPGASPGLAGVPSRCWRTGWRDRVCVGF